MFRIVNSVRTAAKRTAMTARRNFASDAAPPQYEGAEAAVRKVLPKDEQIVAARALGHYLYSTFFRTRRSYWYVVLCQHYTDVLFS